MHLAWREADIDFLEEKLQESTILSYNCYGKAFPKTHMRVHWGDVVRSFGPPRSFWAMRFEMKHQFLKRWACCLDFRNLSKSIMSRYVLCMELGRAKGVAQCAIAEEIVLSRERPAALSVSDISDMSNELRFAYSYNSNFVRDICRQVDCRHIARHVEGTEVRHKGVTLKVGEWIQFYDPDSGVIYTALCARIVVIDVSSFRICFVFVDLSTLCVSRRSDAWPGNVQLLERWLRSSSASNARSQQPVVFDRVLGSVYRSSDERSVLNYRNFQ